MNLVSYNPNHLSENPLERLFFDFGPGACGPVNGGHKVGFVPRVDVREEEKEIVLSAELPGVEKESVKIEVKEGVLTLSGEKKEPVEEQTDGIYRVERSYGSFKRAFNLPEEVDTDSITASYGNGVLELRLAKKPEEQPRLIDIEEKVRDIPVE